MFTRKLIPVLLFALLFAGLSYSQQLPETPKPPSPPPPPLTKEMKLDRLSQKLNLNEQQVKEVDKILTVSEKKLDKIRGKYGDINRDMMTEIKRVIDNQDSEIEKKLTDAQKKKFEQMRKERMNHRPPMAPMPPMPPRQEGQ